MTNVTTDFDDGTELSESYRDGQISFTALSDNRENPDLNDFTRVIASYDTDGKLATRSVVYDNGLVREETRSSDPNEPARVVTLKDNPTDGGNGVRSFESVQTTYDANGQETSRNTTTLRDDGLLVWEIRDNGVKSRKFEYDQSEGGAAFDFEETVTRYRETGDIAYKYLKLDTGDTEFLLFDDGVNAFRAVYDQDESEPWVLSETTYLPDGTSQVVLYDPDDALSQTGIELMNYADDMIA